MTNEDAAKILTAIKNTRVIKWKNNANIAFDLAINALEERPTGEWINIPDAFGDMMVVCSNCKKPMRSLCPPYCEECGAKMREVEK